MASPERAEQSTDPRHVGVLVTPIECAAWPGLNGRVLSGPEGGMGHPRAIAACQLV